MKALLLDFDGTLVDSLPALFQAYLAFLERYGSKGSWQEFQEFNGYGLSDVMKYLKKRHGISAEAENLVKRYYEEVLKLYNASLELFAGTADFIKRLEGRLRLAVVTAAPRRVVEGFLHQRGLYDFFEAVITAEGLEASKPNPAIYRHALEQLRLKAEEAVAVEDSENGMRAALGAGIPTIAIYHRQEHRTTEPPAALGPVTSWQQLEVLLFSPN